MIESTENKENTDLKITDEDLPKIEQEFNETNTNKYFAGYVKRRNEIVDRANRNRIKYNGKVRSRKAKSNWRDNKKNLMKGIKRFHKSTEGKKFHRALNRFNAGRGKDRRAIGEELTDLKLALSSLQTHLIIEERYSMPMNEQVSFSLFKTLMLESVETMLRHLRENQMESFEECFDESIGFYYECIDEETE